MAFNNNSGLNVDEIYNSNDKNPLVPDVHHGLYQKLFQPALAECVGVTLFVFVGCMVVQTGQLSAVGLAHGLMIALLIMGLGNISGGHFNPAVTLGVALSREISPLTAALYFVAQILGGMIGAGLCRAVLPHQAYNMISGGAHTLGPGVEPGWAILAEAVLTTILVFTVLMNAVNAKTKNNLAPLAIGFAVAVDIMAAGGTTGASMNPARSFGPAVAASPVVDAMVWKHHYVYWVGPLIGSLVAFILHRFLFEEKSKHQYHPLPPTTELNWYKL